MMAQIKADHVPETVWNFGGDSTIITVVIVMNVRGCFFFKTRYIIINFTEWLLWNGTFTVVPLPVGSYIAALLGNSYLFPKVLAIRYLLERVAILTLTLKNQKNIEIVHFLTPKYYFFSLTV